MARAISQRCSEQPANASAFAKSLPDPTPRGLTERPSASFKQHCANGPTLAPTTTRISDRTSSRQPVEAPQLGSVARSLLSLGGSGFVASLAHPGVFDC